MIRVAALILCVATLPCRPQAQPLVIRHARVFDGSRTIPRATVVVEGGIIRSVAGSPKIPPNAEIVDAEGRTLLPGLIDSHVHIAVEDANSLRKALLFGVTTLLDMFHPAPDALHRLRQMVATQSGAEFADFRSAGICATVPKGHGTEYGFAIPTIQSPAEAQAFVDARIAEGSEYIKIIHAGNAQTPETSLELMRALVAAAHLRHKTALVCLHNGREAQEALDAGADGLAHLFQTDRIDPEFGRLAAEHHAFVISTASAVFSPCRPKIDAAAASDPYLAPFLTPSDVRTLNLSFPLASPDACGALQQELAQLTRAKVPLLAGTDAPNPGASYGAGLLGELRLLVQGGLTPSQALASATSVPARIFHLDDRGRIEPGKRADLVLVEGDPTQDIECARHISGIWMAGKRVDRQALRQAVAAAIRPNL